MFANLAYSDLRCADLGGADLRYVQLASSRLGQANFAHANLTGGNLNWVTLDGADLSFASLDRATLRYASLRLAKLCNVTLANADLFGAKLHLADLRHSDLGGANLYGAELIGANLSHAKLRGAKLGSANLNHANLSHADLSYADLVGADLSDANLEGANLEGADLTHANLGGANVLDAQLRRARTVDLGNGYSSFESQIVACVQAALLASKFGNSSSLPMLAPSPPTPASGPPALPPPAGYSRETSGNQLPAIVSVAGTSPNMGARAEALILPTRSTKVQPAEDAESRGPSRKRRRGARSRRSRRSAGKSAPSVLIAYGKSDEPFARKLSSALNRGAVKTFFFPEHALPGVNLRQMIRDSVNQCHRTILICSKSSLRSKPVLAEVQETLARERRDGGANCLIPIRIDEYVLSEKLKNANPHISEVLRDRVIADFVGTQTGEKKFGRELVKLIDAITKDAPVAVELKGESRMKSAKRAKKNARRRGVSMKC